MESRHRRKLHKGSYIRLLDSVKSGDVITLVSHVTYILIMQRMNLISALSCMARYCLREDWGRMICPKIGLLTIVLAVNRFRQRIFYVSGSIDRSG